MNPATEVAAVVAVLVNLAARTAPPAPAGAPPAGWRPSWPASPVSWAAERRRQ